MADEQLNTPSRWALLVESCGLLVLAAALMLVWPSSVTSEIYAFADGVVVDEEDDEPLRLSGVVRPDTISTLRWSISEALPTDTPLALQMSGPFSATIYFNGEEVGQKGQPGEDATAERAGPIDYLVALPADALRGRNNEVELVFSSHRAGYEPALIIQSLMVVPYQPDQRRALRYYAALILTSGMLIGLIAVVLYLSRERAYGAGLCIALSLVGLLIAGGAEISRSLISYPYDWHQPRQALQLAGLLLAAGSLAQFTRLRWLPTDWPIWPLCGAMAVASVAAFGTQTGYDSRSILLILLITSITALAVLSALWRDRESGSVLLLPLLCATLVLCLVQPWLYLDQMAYVLAAVFFSHLLARRAQVLLPLPEPSPKPVTFAVPSTGRTIYLSLQDIIALKAAGNYTEIHMRNGEVTLDGRSLSAVLEALPDTFMRVHRSWGANLAEIDALQSRPGSRYHLTMKAGPEVPVGRSQVDAVRQRLG